MRLALPLIMKIAISHWHGRVAPVFDVADGLLLIDTEGDRKLRQENISLAGSRDSFGRAHEVSDLGVQVLLCGAVSHTLETALIGCGIRVIGFLCGELEAVIEAFLQDRLADERFFMPGHHAKSQYSRVRADRSTRRKSSAQPTSPKSKQKGGF